MKLTFRQIQDVKTALLIIPGNGSSIKVWNDWFKFVIENRPKASSGIFYDIPAFNNRQKAVAMLMYGARILPIEFEGTNCIEWCLGYSNKYTPKTRKFQYTQNVCGVLITELLHKEPQKVVCHKCSTKACINPLHAFWGTQSDNMLGVSNRNRKHQTKYHPLFLNDIRNNFDGIISIEDYAKEYDIEKEEMEGILKNDFDHDPNFLRFKSIDSARVFWNKRYLKRKEVE